MHVEPIELQSARRALADFREAEVHRQNGDLVAFAESVDKF